MLQPGTILLEKYRVERVLGKGGMGFVLAARHVHLGELFAIKAMLPEALQQPEALERFLREARACAKLKGEHVARVHDIGKLGDGTPYMLMEHLDGEDLGQILARRGTLPVEEAALYVYQACEAVAEAHAHGIVHRDLKPSNLFLTYRPNGTPCIKVLDFGISKELDQANKVGANLTKTGTFLGSPMYMSPEQMVDLKTTDKRGDVWALGVILYEFVTGKPPFASDIVTAVVSKVLLAHPAPPSQVRVDVPHEFDAVVMRCLEKKPEHRYPSAYELMVALEPFAGIIPGPISPSAERSASLSRSIIIPHAELAGTIVGLGDDSKPQMYDASIPNVAMADTMADPISSVPCIAVAETVWSNGPTSARLDEAPHAAATPLPIKPFIVPLEADSSEEIETPTIPSAVDSPTILPVENEAAKISEKPASGLDSGGRKALIRASAALSACALLGMGFALGTTSAPNAVAPPAMPSTIPPPMPPPTIQVDEPASTDAPKPEVAPVIPEPSATASIEPAPSATTQALDTTPGPPKITAPKAQTATTPRSAPASRRAPTKKSRVPDYDD